jgi:uncharacterized membrane protein YhaH (DUF805 family)
LAYHRVWFEYKNKRWFRGRSTRREWWTELVYLFFISSVAAGIGPIAGATIGAWRLILFWAATARRLHDLNRSAWIQVGVIASFVGFAGGTLALDEGTAWIGGIFWSVSGLINLAFYIWLGFFKGTDGPNTWGEDAPVEW